MILPLTLTVLPLRCHETIFLPVAGPDLSDPPRRKSRGGSWSGLRQKNRRKPTRGAFLLVPFLWACKEKEPGCRVERRPGVGGGGAPLQGNKECLLSNGK